jgi:hypothetical protein
MLIKTYRISHLERQIRGDHKNQILAKMSQMKADAFCKYAWNNYENLWDMASPIDLYGGLASMGGCYRAGPLVTISILDIVHRRLIARIFPELRDDPLRDSRYILLAARRG